MVSASLRVCRLPTKAGFFSRRGSYGRGFATVARRFSSETNACDRSALASRRRRQTLPDVRCSSFHDAVVRKAICPAGLRLCFFFGGAVAKVFQPSGFGFPFRLSIAWLQFRP